MPTRRHPLVPLATFALVAAAIYSTELLIVGSSLFPRRPELASAAVTFDLTLCVPLLFYFLVVRRTEVPALSLVPVFLLSLVGARLVLPAEHRHYLRAAELLVAPVELGVLGWLGLNARRLVRRFRARTDPDVLLRLRETLREFLPGDLVAEIVATEAGILYYALFSWRARPAVGPGDAAFSYHRRNGYAGIVGALAGVTVVETVAVHLLVAGWSTRAAWLLTAFSVYGVVWLIGHLQAVRLRPVLLTPDGLQLRLGLLWSVRVPYARISGVERAKPGPVKRRAPRYLHMVSLGAPQLVLELAEPMDARGMYGLRRRAVSRIGVLVDEPQRFRAELEERIASARG